MQSIHWCVCAHAYFMHTLVLLSLFMLFILLFWPQMPKQIPCSCITELYNSSLHAINMILSCQISFFLYMDWTDTAGAPVVVVEAQSAASGVSSWMNPGAWRQASQISEASGSDRTELTHRCIDLPLQRECDGVNTQGSEKRRKETHRWTVWRRCQSSMRASDRALVTFSVWL